jgi:hypothetical protein
MRLSPYDDLPFHQALAPVDAPFTSDSHWNDGYYFAFYRDGLHAFAGLRLHANNNVMDGYAGVVDHDEQRSLRVSRALRPGPGELEVDALSLEIVEPMQRQRLRLADNPTGVEFDVTFAASAAPFFESPHVQHRHGRLINHVLRYTQVCRASGELRLDGERIEVDGWHAARDHSWGIRSTMGPHVPIRGVAVEGGAADPRAIRLWVPFEAGDRSGFFHTHEDEHGDTLDFEGRIDGADGGSVELAGVEHELSYHPGTRRLRGGAFGLTGVDGSRHRYEFEVCCAPAHPQGFGYTRGWADGGQPGAWRGAEHSEHERFAVSDPGARAAPDHVPPERRLGGTEFAARLCGPDGAAGMAHVEHMIYGAYRPYGFEDGAAA